MTSLNTASSHLKSIKTSKSKFSINDCTSGKWICASSLIFWRALGNLQRNLTIFVIAADAVSYDANKNVNKLHNSKQNNKPTQTQKRKLRNNLFIRQTHYWQHVLAYRRAFFWSVLWNESVQVWDTSKTDESCKQFLIQWQNSEEEKFCFQTTVTRKL